MLTIIAILVCLSAAVFATALLVFVPFYSHEDHTSTSHVTSTDTDPVLAGVAYHARHIAANEAHIHTPDIDVANYGHDTLNYSDPTAWNEHTIDTDKPSQEFDARSEV